MVFSLFLMYTTNFDLLELIPKKKTNNNKTTLKGKKISQAKEITAVFCYRCKYKPLH